MTTATTMFADATLGLSAQALAILQLLAAEDSDDPQLSIATRAWYNGRENGVSLTVRAKLTDDRALIVTFAEHRISDSIAIETWVLEGNIPDPPTPNDCRNDSDHWTVKRGHLHKALDIIHEAIDSFLQDEPLVRVAKRAATPRRERRLT